jgi:hypothetical protein
MQIVPLHCDMRIRRLKSHVLFSWRKAASNRNATSPVGFFQTRGPATREARLPTVDRLNDGTNILVVPAEPMENCNS